MLDAETVARCSAWPAVLCYAATLGLRLSCRDSKHERLIRGLWTAGWLALVLHIGLALSLFHGGNWNAAYEHTARRTQLAVGWNWGGGVWFNLLTAVVWGIDLAWLWRRTVEANRKQPWLDICCQVYLAFMIFNATVVFGSLAAQIAGGLICIGLASAAICGRNPYLAPWFNP